ncbi:hypothetical protein ACEV87_22550 [Vibrio parahaemolyticus]
MRIERTVSCAAMFISFLALVISIWQGYEAKKHNRLSFTPYLQISPRLVGDISSGLYLENAGTGTAFFKSIGIIVNGNKFDLTKNQWGQFLSSVDINPVCFKKSWIRSDSAMQAGKELALISLSEADLPLPYCLQQVTRLLTLEEVEIRINYKSIYEEEFKLEEKYAIKSDELQ